MCEWSVRRSNNEPKADRSLDISASPLFVSEVTSSVVDSDEVIAEGPFITACDSPGGVGEVLTALLVFL